jgi:DNA-binding NtrC family response regulator
MKKKIIIAGRKDGWVPYFQKELTKKGLSVKLVETFQEMRNILNNKRFDLAIPTNDDWSKGLGMSEFVSELKENYPKMLVIVMSGYADLGIAIDYQKRGADDFIAIPFEPNETVDYIVKMLT